MRTVALKYCGGCNSRFERVGFANRLFHEFPTLAPVGSNIEGAWLALVICGCSRGCAEHSHMHAQNGKVIVCDEAEYDRVLEYIRGLL